MQKGKSSKKLLLVITISALLSSFLMAGGIPEDDPIAIENNSNLSNLFVYNTESEKEKISTKKEVQEPVIEAQRLLEQLKSGPKDNVFVLFDKNDLKLAVGGKTSVDSYLANNVVMLNKEIPDEYSYFKQTIDLTGDITYGQEKFGHEAVRFYGDLRAKAVWGDSGSACSTVSETVKLDGIDVVVGSHKHLNKKAYINVREAWLQFSVNSIANLHSTKLQFVKLGFFPFKLGRGIALGSVYGLGKDFLGISSSYNSDQFAPGINIHGDIIKDLLNYDFYFAKLEEQSDNLSKTFNFIKANHIGRGSNPWRGVAKDNDLIAGRIKWKAVNSKKKGELDLEPYVLFNEASDRKIEFEADAKSELGTAGMSLEYKNNNFEFGAEGAFNFGQETAYNIDRNTTTIARDATTAQVLVKYSKVLDGSATGNPVIVTNDIKTLVEASSNTTNGDFIGTASGKNLYNSITSSTKNNRFRPRYTTKYGGWMFVADIAYTVQKADLKLATGYGYASGDADPHRPYTSDVEKDKTYSGFIGLQEWYAGKRVQSVLFLDARKIKRPLTQNTMERNQLPADSDGTFTDMHYLGINATWFPLEHNTNKFSLATNVLGYWKAHTAHKYDQVAEEVDTTQNAGKFMGAEWNIRLRYEALKNLHVYGDFAVFFPGTYYHDVKGTPLASDFYNKLNTANRTGVDPADYRLGSDTAYYMNLGVFYKF